MKSDVGFILVKSNNEKIYDDIFKTIKNIEDNNPYNQTLIFNSYNEKVETYNLPILHLSQAQFFYGTLFLFDLPSIILSNRFPNVTKRILYTGSLPWYANSTTTYQEWASLYNQENLDIITSNTELYDIYSICWKKPLGVSERFSYEEIIDLI